MDVSFRIGDDRFVWDVDKSAVNVAKHGINFFQASEVFLDPLLLLEDASAGHEQRWIGIGITKDWKLTCVVHLERTDGILRLIPARRATAAERERYEDDE